MAKGDFSITPEQKVEALAGVLDGLMIVGTIKEIQKTEAAVTCLLKDVATNLQNFSTSLDQDRRS